MRSVPVLALLPLLVGCLHTHPVGALQRMAKKQDRDWQRDLEEAPEDGQFWVQRTEALAIAAETVATVAPLVSVDTDGVKSDWVYTADSGIDEGGEWHLQQRTRAAAALSGNQQQRVELVKREQKRTLRAGLDAPGFAGGDEPWEVEEATKQLTELESKHLSRPTLKAEEAAFRRVATNLSPKGYGIAVDEPGRLVAERYITEGKTSKNGAKTAAWHSRSQVELLITSGGAVDVQLHNEHRFDTDKGNGEWTPAETTDGQRAREWIKALLAEPRSGLHIPDATLSAPPEVDQAETPPPKVARLRTMPEIQQEIANRAITTSTGDFRVCMAGALLPAFNPGGGTWDPDPADPSGGPTHQGGPRSPEEALGGTRGILPTIGTLPNTTSVAREIPVIEDFAAGAALTEQAAGLEQKLPGYSPLKLPAHPDIAGKLELGGKAPLSVVSDRLAATWEDACVEKRFKNGIPGISVELWDEEEDGPAEPVATCTFDLTTVLSKGAAGIECGDARVFLHATYRFDMPQIEFVGLPPVRSE